MLSSLACSRCVQKHQVTQGAQDCSQQYTPHPAARFLPCHRAEPALGVAQRVLGRAHMAGLELYSFRSAPVNDRLYMRIDKVPGLPKYPSLPCDAPSMAAKRLWTALLLALVGIFLAVPPSLARDKSFRQVVGDSVHQCCVVQLEDMYGSPSMDDITDFSREFYAELEAELGEEAAGKLQIEVSSPVRWHCLLPSFQASANICATCMHPILCCVVRQGAERLVRVPGELLRFQSLPMQARLI